MPFIYIIYFIYVFLFLFRHVFFTDGLNVTLVFSKIDGFFSWRAFRMVAFMWGGGHFYLLETQGISEVCYRHRYLYDACDMLCCRISCNNSNRVARDKDSLLLGKFTKRDAGIFTKILGQLFEIPVLIFSTVCQMIPFFFTVILVYPGLCVDDGHSQAEVVFVILYM